MTAHDYIPIAGTLFVIVAFLWFFASYFEAHFHIQSQLPDIQPKGDEVALYGVNEAADELIEVKYTPKSYPFKERTIAMYRMQKETWDLMTDSDKSDYIKQSDRLIAKGKMKKQTVGEIIEEVKAKE